MYSSGEVFDPVRDPLPSAESARGFVPRLSRQLSHGLCGDQRVQLVHVHYFPLCIHALKKIVIINVPGVVIYYFHVQMKALRR